MINSQALGSFVYVQRSDGTYRQSTEGSNPKKVCSFWPHVTNTRIERRRSGDLLCFDLCMSSTTEEMILSNQTERTLHNMRWDTLPAAFRISPPVRSNREFFLEFIQQQLAQFTPLVIYTPERQGWNSANGQLYFLYGDHLILPASLADKVIPPTPPTFTVTINDTFSEKDVASWFTHVLFSTRTLSLMLCLANVLGLLYSKLRECGHCPEGWLWLVGRSSAGKTSLAQMLCCLYNRTDGLKSCTIPASSSIAYASRKIQSLKDTCCILDDRAITEGTSLAHKQTTLIDSLLRSSSNGVTRGVCVSGEDPALCYFIGTAEEGFHAVSVANRGIILEIPDERIDFSELNRCFEAGDHFLETFYMYFIYWLVQRKDLDDWLNKHAYKAAYLPDSHLLKSPRIASHIAFFHLAGELLMDYLASLNLFEAEEEEQNWRTLINSQLQRVYERQLVLLSRIEKPKDRWLVEALFEILRSGKLRIVKSSHLLFPLNCDGFMYNETPQRDLICIHRDSFFRVLDEHGIRISIHNVRKALAPYDILVYGSEGETTRNIGGERGIAINWSQLVKVASTSNRQKS